MRKFIILILALLVVFGWVERVFADNEVVIKKIIVDGKESKDELLKTRLTLELKSVFNCNKIDTAQNEKIIIEFIEIWKEKDKEGDTFTGMIAATINKGFFKEYGLGDGRGALEEAIDTVCGTIYDRFCKK